MSAQPVTAPSSPPSRQRPPTPRIRLRGDREPLWRDAMSLQFGLGRDAPRWDDPSPPEQRLLAALTGGFPRDVLVHVAESSGMDAADAYAVIDRLRGRHLLAEQPDDPRPVVLRAVADDIGRRVLDLLADAFGGLDVPVLDEHEAGADATVVLIAAEICTPRDGAPLLRDDRPHVPLVLRGHGVGVGPLVLPGSTACLSCVAATETEGDGAWPYLMSQLVGRRSPDVPLFAVAEAAAVVARLCTDAIATAPASRSVEVSRYEPRRWRTHRPHPACSCRGFAPPADG